MVFSSEEEFGTDFVNLIGEEANEANEMKVDSKNERKECLLDSNKECQFDPNKLLKNHESTFQSSTGFTTQKASSNRPQWHLQTPSKKNLIEDDDLSPLEDFYSLKDAASDDEDAKYFLQMFPSSNEQPSSNHQHHFQSMMEPEKKSKTFFKKKWFKR